MDQGRRARSGPDIPVEKESGRLGPGLKEIGIEHQLQLARLFRWGLATIQFETLGLLVLRIGIELEIVLRGCSSGRLGWRARAGTGSQRACVTSSK